MAGFNDLLEIRFVNAFVEMGLPLQRIRRALLELQHQVGVEYPFSRRQVITDGEQIYRKIVIDGKSLFYDLSGSRNYAMYEVVERELLDAIEWDESGQARRLTPDRKIAKVIVIDPRVSFGRPFVRDQGIPASALASAYKVERNYDRVAAWYEIPASTVRQAVAFHKKYAV